MSGQMTIGKRVGLGFFIVVLLLTVVAVWSVLGIGRIVRNAGEVIDGNALRGEIVQRELDHVKWAGKLNSLLTNDEITSLAELQLETDHTQCGFGKWYYGDAGKNAKEMIPELAPILKEIENPHEMLHRSAIKIGDVFVQADLSLPGFLAEKEVDHLKWTNECLALFAQNKESLEVQMDDHLCGFGKFLYGEKGREIAAKDKQLGALIEKIKPPHQRLHESAKEIAENWEHSREGLTDLEAEAGTLEKQKAAREVFEKKTLPALHETQAVLAEMKTRAQEMVSSMEQANEIYNTETSAHLEKVQGLLRALVETTNEQMMTDEEMISAAQSTRIAVLGLSAVAFTAGILLAIFITRGIVRVLSRIIAGLQRGSEEVSAASVQVSQASEQLAEGASEQASSLEETSSSLEEMASMTRQNADNAKQAATLSNTAQNAAAKGDEAMQRMAEAIEKIKSSSDDTARIIKTIDEIAFQTNLLALNAAVEAARAGEAGKGFAVVAEEVRNLAQRSAEAAKNTSELIEGSQQDAENGVKVSSEVASILTQIGDSIQKVNQLIGEVSAANEEQAQGIDQVNLAVAQMDKVTQSNAANAEESASAGEELSAQAQQLDAMVLQLVSIVSGAGAKGEADRVAKTQPHRLGMSHVTPKTIGPSRKHLALAAKQKQMICPDEVIPLEDGDLEEF